MAKALNNVLIMGNLTRDPELRQTPGGKSVTSFSLALNRSYKDSNDEWQEATDYVDCVTWGQLAEQMQQVTKGSRVLVTGRLQTRQYEKDGEKRSKTEVLAQDVTFVDIKE